MPSSADNRAEQQRARRAVDAAAKVAGTANAESNAVADGAEEAFTGGASTPGKLTPEALAEAGTSVMHAHLDELVIVTSADADKHEQQWRGGTNRQLQPAAHTHIRWLLLTQLPRSAKLQRCQQ